MKQTKTTTVYRGESKRKNLTSNQYSNCSHFFQEKLQRIMKENASIIHLNNFFERSAHIKVLLPEDLKQK